MSDMHDIGCYLGYEFDLVVVEGSYFRESIILRVDITESGYY